MAFGFCLAGWVYAKAAPRASDYNVAIILRKAPASPQQSIGSLVSGAAQWPSLRRTVAFDESAPTVVSQKAKPQSVAQNAPVVAPSVQAAALQSPKPAAVSSGGTVDDDDGEWEYYDEYVEQEVKPEPEIYEVGPDGAIDASVPTSKGKSQGRAKTTVVRVQRRRRVAQPAPSVASSPPAGPGAQRQGLQPALNVGAAGASASSATLASAAAALAGGRLGELD